MDEPRWAITLEKLYKHGDEIGVPVDGVGSPVLVDNIESGHPFADIDIGPEELKNDILFLSNHNLISSRYADFRSEDEHGDGVDPRQWKIKLDTDGFDVAHDREQTKSQNQISRALVSFTFILVIVNTVSLVPYLPVRVFGSLATFFLLLVVLVWTDLLQW